MTSLKNGAQPWAFARNPRAAPPTILRTRKRYGIVNVTALDQPAASSRRQQSLGNLFVGKQGLRIGWRVMIFIAIYQVLEWAGFAVLQKVGMLASRQPIPPSAAFLQEGWDLVCVAIATGVMARWERRGLLSYGFAGPLAWWRLLSGMAWGLICLSGVLGLMSSLGFITFEGRALSTSLAWQYGLAWASVCLVVGLFEESLLRGYLQQALASAMGFWPAALLLSIAFALWHLDNNGESLFGLLVVGVGGLVFCLSLWYTKSLWWAVGFHAGWDWGQSYLYGVPDSGLMMTGHLFTSHPSGNPLWSGGSTGPEGSLCMLPLLMLMAAGMWLWWGRIKRPAIT
jgi:uncharacterized protein